MWHKSTMQKSYSVYYNIIMKKWEKVPRSVGAAEPAEVSQLWFLVVNALRWDSSPCSWRDVLLWERLVSVYLDAEGEVSRRSVQLPAVHHGVHVQVVQVGHVLQVSRLLLAKHTLQNSFIHVIKRVFSLVSEWAFWPLRILWWSSRVRSGGGRSRPSSRLSGWTLWPAGIPGSQDTSRTSAGSEEHKQVL